MTNEQAVRLAVGDAVVAESVTPSGTVTSEGVIVRRATRDEVRYGTGWIVRDFVTREDVAFHQDRLTFTGVAGHLDPRS